MPDTRKSKLKELEERLSAVESLLQQTAEEHKTAMSQLIEARTDIERLKADAKNLWVMNANRISGNQTN